MDASSTSVTESNHTPAGNNASDESNLTRSDLSHISEQKEQSIGDLVKESQELQKDINSIFAELSDINRQVRIDIDDFCRIGLNNTSSILNSSRSE